MIKIYGTIHVSSVQENFLGIKVCAVSVNAQEMRVSMNNSTEKVKLSKVVDKMGLENLTPDVDTS